MSGFIKRERSVNTVNPAGGVNPASTPNVSQYGWTKFEASVVNQLIGYVNAARDSADLAQATADYIKDRLTIVDNYTQFIMDGLADFENKYVDFITKYDDVVHLHSEVENIEKIVSLYHDNIKQYALQTYTDTITAESWAYMSFITYLDTKGQLVDKGDYSIVAGGMLPTKPSENSIWKVNVAGPSRVELGGFHWNTGDRLTFTLRENKFNQIKKAYYTFYGVD